MRDRARRLTVCIVWLLRPDEVRAQSGPTVTCYRAHAAVLAHGVIEAGMVMGSTLNGMMLPFGIALFDRLPEMLHESGARRGEAKGYASPDSAMIEDGKPDDGRKGL